MPLSAGTRIGAYEIVSALGAGGMGEVFRARDTKLHRDVAIKVLPESVANDADRLARFEREAQTLAAVNHPRIAQIYGLEEIDAGAGRVLALVMEYVAGDDLAARLARGALPIDDAIAVAAQIADGLEAAHERGIVHRDLKPANVKVTAGGEVKLLDFGLAKAASADPESTANTQSPTFTSPPQLTQAGALLGTAPYMAPEQVRGRPIDRRADIWAFGCVVYEMLAGHPVFHGESIADTLGTIVRDEPRWEDLPAATPAVVRRLLTRCLVKDPRRRLRDIGEARIALEDQLSGKAETVAVVNSTAPPARSRLIWIAALAALALAPALATVARRTWRAPATTFAPVVRFDVQPPAKAVLKLDLRPAMALSPDGSTLVFAAILDGTVRLYTRALDAVDARPLPGTEGGTSPAFSPDGQWIAFFADGKVKKVSLEGAPVTLANAPDVRGITWQDDHTLIYPSGAADGLVALSADGGTTRPISKLEANERTHRWPDMLPGGKAVMFSVGSTASPDSYDDATIEAVVLATGERRVIWRGAAFARYSPSGHLLLSRGSGLYAVPFNPETLVATGNPTQVLQGIERDTTTGAAHFACAADGTLAFVPGGGQTGVFRLVWVDSKGASQPLGLEPGLHHEARISPDGTRVAYVNGPSGAGDVWIYDTVRRTNTRLTFTANNAGPTWSPDGKSVLYTSFDASGASSNVYRKLADGSREAELVASPGARSYVAWVAKDGASAVLDFVNPGAGMADVIKMDLRRDAKATPIVADAADTYGAAVSPDGRWVAYHSNATGQYEIYVRDLSGTGGQWQISTTGGEEPHWSKDGRELYYRTANRMMVASIEHEPVFRSGTPRTLFDGVYNWRSDSLRSYDVDPVSGRFLMIRPVDEGQSPTAIRVTINWFEELRRLVPAR